MWSRTTILSRSSVVLAIGFSSLIALIAVLGFGAVRRAKAIYREMETTQESYREQGYLGCLMGGLGQELSGINDVFRRKIEECLSAITARLTICLEEARQNGDIPADSDARHMADVLVDCWEGAALRSRLRRDASSLTAMLDFYFQSVAVH